MGRFCWKKQIGSVPLKAVTGQSCVKQDESGPAGQQRAIMLHVFASPVSVWASLAGRSAGAFLLPSKPFLRSWILQLLSPSSPSSVPSAAVVSGARFARHVPARGRVPACRSLPLGQRHPPAALVSTALPSPPLARRRGRAAVLPRCGGWCRSRCPQPWERGCRLRAPVRPGAGGSPHAA